MCKKGIIQQVRENFILRAMGGGEADTLGVGKAEAEESI